MTGQRVPVLTVWQPWGSAMFLPGLLAKPVENRGRRWTYTGPAWIHAGTTWDTAGELAPVVIAAWQLARLGDPRPDNPAIPAGAVLGQVTVTGCHHANDCTGQPGGRCNPWAADGQWHITLADPRPLACPVTVRGQRGIWYLPADVETLCLAQLTAAPVA